MNKEVTDFIEKTRQVIQKALNSKEYYIQQRQDNHGERYFIYCQNQDDPFCNEEVDKAEAKISADNFFKLLSHVALTYESVQDILTDKKLRVSIDMFQFENIKANALWGSLLSSDMNMQEFKSFMAWFNSDSIIEPVVVLQALDKYNLSTQHIKALITSGLNFGSQTESPASSYDFFNQYLTHIEKLPEEEREQTFIDFLRASEFSQTYKYVKINAVKRFVTPENQPQVYEEVLGVLPNKTTLNISASQTLLIRIDYEFIAMNYDFENNVNLTLSLQQIAPLLNRYANKMGLNNIILSGVVNNNNEGTTGLFLEALPGLEINKQLFQSVFNECLKMAQENSLNTLHEPKHFDDLLSYCSIKNSLPEKNPGVTQRLKI